MVRIPLPPSWNLVAALLGAVLLTAPPAQADLPAPPALRLGDEVLLLPHLQYRPRLLVHEGRDFRPGGSSATFRQRASLGLEGRFFHWITANIQLQDVRVWGSETDTLADFSADGFDLHQAWAEFRCPLGIYLRVGRQEVNWDNQRLIGAVGWSDQGRSLDALRLGFRHGKAVDAELLYAVVLDREAFLGSQSGTAAEDVHLAGLHARFAFLEAVRPALVAIYDHQGDQSQDRATFGLYVDGAPLSGLSYSAEFFYQLGRREVAGQALDLRALLGAVKVGYTLPLKLAPGLSLWFEYLSGDDDPADQTTRTFDTLYATNHKFYGFMDFFLNIPAHTGGLGLIDAGGRVQLKPARGLLVFVDFHHFELARKDPQSGATTLGNELDILARYAINRYLTVEAVFALFEPKLGASLQRRDPQSGALGDRVETYGYLQFDLKL